MINDHRDFLFETGCKLMGLVYLVQTGKDYFNPFVAKP
jgi:hypothetical protein